MRRQYEHAEQVALCRWLDFRQIPYAAIPNGGHRHVAVARKLKAEGVKAGVPDVVLFKPSLHEGITKHVMVELKRPHMRGVPKGRTSVPQREMHEVLRNNAWIVVVAFGFDDAIKQLQALGY